MNKTKKKVTVKEEKTNKLNTLSLILIIIIVLSLILNVYLFIKIRSLNKEIIDLNQEIISLKEAKEKKMTDEKLNPKVIMETSKGNIIIELYQDLAPKTVDNFLKMVNQGKYDGLSFHRIIKGFMIQGGDPKGDGTGGNLLPFEGSTLKHTPGVISMAATQGGKNQSDMQFFIMHGTSPHLDGLYTAFGKVVGGMEIVDLIANSEVKIGPSGEKSTPVENIKIIKITELKN